MTRLRLAATCGAVLAAMTCAATGPLTASASAAEAAETDTAVIRATIGGYLCTFASSDGQVGSCTVNSVSLGAGCFALPLLLRSGSITLVEPSQQSVALNLTVVGLNTGGVFAGSGSDGGAAATASGTYSVTCRGDIQTGADFTVSWTAG